MLGLPRLWDLIQSLYSCSQTVDQENPTHLLIWFFIKKHLKQGSFIITADATITLQFPTFPNQDMPRETEHPPDTESGSLFRTPS